MAKSWEEQRRMLWRRLTGKADLLNRQPAKHRKADHHLQHQEQRRLLQHLLLLTHLDLDVDQIKNNVNDGHGVTPVQILKTLQTGRSST